MLNKKGFTLIELIIVMAVFAILASMAVSVFSFGLKSNQKNQEQQESTSTLRLVSSIVEKDIRKSSQNLELIHDNNNPNCFKLLDLDDSETTDSEVSYDYCLQGDNLYRNQVFLIDKIKAFEMHEITDETSSELIGITIKIKDQGGEDYDQEIYFRH